MRTRDFPYAYAVTCHGVELAVHVNRASVISHVKNIVKAALPLPFEAIDPATAKHHIYFQYRRDGQDGLFGGPSGENLVGIPRKNSIELLESWIRLRIAEFTPEHVFVHAGVVGWKGRAIIIPGASYSGKTSLTVELIRRGATYYSDEYAVIDKQGLVAPFPKTLSIRGEVNAYTQVEYPFETFGATLGTEKIPIAIVLISKYVPRARWNPKDLALGEGIIEILKNTVSARTNPSLVLSTLSNVGAEARFVRSDRGEARKVVDWLSSVIT
jgi:hypothetical protein